MRTAPVERIYDSHVHFPMNSDRPYEVLRDKLIESGINEFLLILNGDDEFDCYKSYRTYFSEDGLKPDLAVILDVRRKDWKTHFDYLNSNGIKYNVKIHPRLTKISLSDFDLIVTKIEELNCQNIIVDNWIYGPDLENHIGTELAIYLSKAFQNRNVIIAHAGGFKVLEVMMLTRPLNNIYYDLSEINQYFNGCSVEMDLIHVLKYSKGKMMFGSDYPSFDVSESIASAYSHAISAGFSKDDIKDLFFSIANRLFSNC